MAKYLFVYHGGEDPKTDDEIKKVMDAWGAWLEGLGSAVIDGGNPVGMSSTVHPDGRVTADGGSNPTSGYSLIEADNDEDAIEKAKACPILMSKGSIELAQAFDM
jgi:hypothetical protein